METYFRYLTQLDLVRRNIGKNSNLSRISLILIDNCIELFCYDYIHRNYAQDNKIHSSINYKKKLDAVIRHNQNNKIITPYIQSIILLFHYYRNKLYHTGDFEGINIIYHHLNLFFNVVVDVIISLGHDNGFRINMLENYESLFKKYNPKFKFSIFGNCDYESIKTAFTNMKLKLDKSSVRSDFISMLSYLVQEWNDEISKILSFGEKRTVLDELKSDFDHHPQRNHNNDFEYQYKKFSKDADKILDKFEKIKKNEKKSRFFSDVLKLEVQLLFLLDLISEAGSQVDMIIDDQIEEMKIAQHEK